MRTAWLEEGARCADAASPVQATFRANTAAYELVSRTSLSAAERSALAPSLRDPCFYGIMRPLPGTPGAIKTVDRDSARLFRALRHPGTVPTFLHARLQAAGHGTLPRLVLDGVLEVRWEGEFRSGADALPWVAEVAGPLPEPEGWLAELSIRAVRYGEALALDDPQALSWRLYCYGRAPVTPAWQSRLPTPASVAAYLRLGAGGALPDAAGRHWSARPGADRDAAWWFWRAKHRPPGGWGTTHKLYVSPSAGALPEALPVVAQALAEAGAAAFKVGASLAGVLRPDKLVAYFASREALLDAADLLAPRLRGCEPHGVPFTAEIADRGLLSWGMDPQWGPALEGGERESWRLWVTNQLAIALVAARRGGEAVGAPWQLALYRLSASGVDVATWTPRPDPHASAPP